MAQRESPYALQNADRYAAGLLTETVDLDDHIRALRRYAYVLVGNASDADDIVQETLKRALIYLHEGKEIHNLRSYLFTMLHHVSNDHRKRERRGGNMLPISDDMLLAVPPSQPDQLHWRDVTAAIQRLPAEQREVLLLVAFEGVSYQDATEILDVPIGTIMSRLSRGRNAIRAQLGVRNDASADAAEDSPWRIAYARWSS